MLPSIYSPQKPDDFDGPARDLARLVDKILALATPNQDPIKLFWYGKPGLGKSALADYTMARLGVNKWHTTKFNGTQLKIEAVEEVAKTLHYRELFGQYRVVRIDEVDKVPNVAQVR